MKSCPDRIFAAAAFGILEDPCGQLSWLRAKLWHVSPNFLFVRTGAGFLWSYIPFKTLEDGLPHGLALQGRLRLDLAPQFYVDVSLRM